jgi:predicted dehydrogenase
MPTKSCRWGILGTANIARKNWQAMARAGNSTLTAVASRDRARAQRFIDECQADVAWHQPPVACGSYDELLARDDIDAVYIPLPTGIRQHWVMTAAAAGKHVLCEKPCGVDVNAVRAMVETCRQHNVQFMDGVMFMHSSRLGLLRQTLDDPSALGGVRRITSHFSFLAPDEFMTHNIRVRNDLEPLGCLGDLGWYNIRLALWVMREQLPERVSGRMLAEHGESGRPTVPLEFSGELFFPGGVTSSFYCSFLSGHQQWANLSGPQGYVHLADFVLPYFGSEAAFEINKAHFRVIGCDFNMENHTRRLAVHEYSNSSADSQETNMIRTFARIVTSGKFEPHWGEQALKTQQVLDACLHSRHCLDGLYSLSLIRFRV